MSVPKDEHDATVKVLTSILRQRDTLLHAAQHFLNLVDDEDFGNLTPEQKIAIQDLAMFAGCTNLSWWGK